jgi:hypothetical protein
MDDGDVDANVGYWDALRDAFSELPAAIADGPLAHEMPGEPWTWRVISWSFVKPPQILGILNLEQYENLKRVTTFYPDDWGRSWMDVFLVMVPVAAIASAFGGIHCIGWSFIFPSSLEQTLWRLASVSITIVPIVIPSLAYATGRLPREYIAQQEDFYAFITWILPLFFYIFGRFVLIVIPFLCLRSLPPAAYYIVHWTSLIPHV